MSNLEHPFLINCQVPGVTDLGLAPRQVNKVAILGGGLMGSGIATALILSNYPVILKEVNEKFLEAGINRVKGVAMLSCICYRNVRCDILFCFIN